MKQVLIIATIALVVLAVFVLYKSGFFSSPYEIFYAGETHHFRANLFEADKIPIYPDEESIKNVLLNSEVYKIYIAYFPNETENSFYFASTFEIVNKLGKIYIEYFKESNVSTFMDTDESPCLFFTSNRQIRCFKSLPINSTDELSPTSIEPVILLLGPSNSNNTAVFVNSNLITLEGKDFSEIDRKYTDLDLSVAKMLLVFMKES